LHRGGVRLSLKGLAGDIRDLSTEEVHVHPHRRPSKEWEGPATSAPDSRL
jgi:hypothetical protein